MMKMRGMKMTTRKSWDKFFIEVAEKFSERATCDRLRVGCVLVRDNRVIVEGYNGSLPGQPHCDEIGHLMLNDHCVRTVHAEANALMQAAYFGIPTAGAVCYNNWFPCLDCLKLLISAGITKVYYKDIYRPDRKANYPPEIMSIIPIVKVNIE